MGNLHQPQLYPPMYLVPLLALFMLPDSVVAQIVTAPHRAMVRVLYVIPQDRPVRSDYGAAVENAIVDLRSWYEGQLSGKTFSLFSVQPETCRLPRPADYYVIDSWTKVFSDVQGCASVSYNSSNFVWVLYVDIIHACNAPGRLGAGTSGVTMLPRQDMDGLIGARYIDDCGIEYRFPPRRFVGGLGHELGHAFGLPHPPGCDAGLPTCDQNALMWAGFYQYPNTYLRPEEKQFLLTTPFFSCSSIAPASESFSSAGGTGSVSITAPTGCTWTAVSNAGFLTITSGSSGSGNGTVRYAVASNSGTVSRTGTLTVAGQTLTVTQAGAGPTLAEGGVVNSASFAPAPAPVTPGSIAAIFGSSLNDGSTVLASRFGSDGKLVTTLGGASVTINNISAPLFYSSPGQLGVQIPFELAGQTSAAIQVSVGGQSSVSRTIFLDALAPGIFTANNQGTGAAAVLHEDGVTPVTAQSPARPGEIVVLYATGLGAVTPPLATGAPSTGNRTAVTATVTIDGVAAGVEFSGTAPGFVGLNQINVRIPASTRSDPNIPMVLQVGGKQSNTVTIAVAAP